MILSARIAKSGVIRLRNVIRQLTGVNLLVSSRITDISRHPLDFRYGLSTPLPSSISSKETEFNTPESIQFLLNKKTFSDYLLKNGFISPEFKNTEPQQSDYPLIVRETLTSYGGRGMHIVRTPEEFTAVWLPNFWWCRYIPTKNEYRFHIGNSKTDGAQILRCMMKVPRNTEIKERDVHIRHVDEYHYSKRFDPTEKFPNWSEQIKHLVSILPGWLYSLDVGVSLSGNLVFFEANTASGIDNGCARDYAPFIIKELNLEG